MTETMKEQGQLDQNLQEITSWVTRGTLTQFANEVLAKIEDEGYTVERGGNTLTIYRTEKKGGLLGVGGGTVKQPVLRIVRADEYVTIPEDSVDPRFVRMLAKYLEKH